MRKAARQTTTTNSQSAERQEPALSWEAGEGTGTRAAGAARSEGGAGAVCTALREAAALAGVSTPGAGAQLQRDARSSTTQAGPKVREPSPGSSGQGSERKATRPEQDRL